MELWEVDKSAGVRKLAANWRVGEREAGVSD